MGIISVIQEKISYIHLNLLILLGLSLVGGVFGGKFFEKIRIPQVIGYIVIGIILGSTGLGIINSGVLLKLEPLNYFALGLIAFMIGGELKLETLRRYGKQFISILFAEGLFAYILVSLTTGILSYIFTKDWRIAIASGILLGSIASATDAASTINVLWELKAKGPLTTTTLGIVALDDGLSFLLFVLSAVGANIILGVKSTTPVHVFFQAFYEIAGSIILGGLGGLILVHIIRKDQERQRILAFSLGAVLLIIGISLTIGVDMLLSAMSAGFVVTNRSPQRSKNIFSVLEGFSAPIYVMFFILVGAKLNIRGMNLLLFILAGSYIIFRTIGKMFGAYLGAKISGAPVVVRKYLAWGLFCQASAAIGLSILAGQHFKNDTGNLIVSVVTLTTFILQLVGPAVVKIAVEKAKEAGKNITEKDLLKKIKVGEIMDRNMPPVYESTPLREIWQIYSNTENLYYPVVDHNRKLKGILSIETIKNTLNLVDMSQAIVAQDLMSKPATQTGRDATLDEINPKLQSLGYCPVVSEDGTLTGFLDAAKVRKTISKKYLRQIMEE